MGRAEFEKGMIPYIEHLHSLPFVQRVDVSKTGSDGSDSGPDILVKTPTGTLAIQVKWSKSHLGTQQVDHLLHSAKKAGHTTMLFAPRVAGDSAEQFQNAGVNYVDLAGNCFVRLGSQYIAQVEGRSSPQREPKEKSLRPASVRVLFTLLADPQAIEQTVRQVAARSGSVSPQTVTDLRKRLVAEGCATAVGRQFKWNPKGREQALDLLVSNYYILARKLEVGRYRARFPEIARIEAEIRRSLGEKKWDWWWGGGAALSRMTGYYRGTRTIVYTDRFLGVGGPKGLIRSEDGNVIIANLPGAVAQPGEVTSDKVRTVHPLLIYLDLMSEGQERALDAAAEVRRTLFEGRGE